MSDVPRGSETRRAERRAARTMTRVAVAVAERVHAGAGWDDAISDAARVLGVSPAAVAWSVDVEARRLRDPYLETIGT